MNREDIIRMAREAGDDWEHTLPKDRAFLERFAALVAAAEREACARVAEIKLVDGPKAIAAAIRARGET